MEEDKSDSFTCLSQQYFDELNQINSLIFSTIHICLEKEFNSEYYGLTEKKTKRLSEERNHYINLLNITSEKLNNIIYLYEKHEDKFIKS